MNQHIYLNNGDMLYNACWEPRVLNNGASQNALRHKAFHQ